MQVLLQTVDCEYWTMAHPWCDCGLCDGTGHVERAIRCSNCGDDSHIMHKGKPLCGCCYYDLTGKDIPVADGPWVMIVERERAA